MNWYHNFKLAAGVFQAPPAIIQSIERIVIPLHKQCMDALHSKGKPNEIEPPIPQGGDQQFTIPIDLTGWKYPQFQHQQWTSFPLVVINEPPQGWDGMWSPSEKTMYFRLQRADFNPAYFQMIIDHEVKHFAQQYASESLGMKKRPFVGQPRKRERTPEYNSLTSLKPDLKSPNYNVTHDMDDMEFQTELGDAIVKLDGWLERYPEDTGRALDEFFTRNYLLKDLGVAGKDGWPKLRHVLHVLRDHFEEKKGPAKEWVAWQKKLLAPTFA